VESLLLLGDSLGSILNRLVILVSEDIFTGVGIVEETGVGGWTVTELHSKFLLQSFTQHVGT